MESEARHSRSFGGCATCRSRRTKCDQGRPTCAVCQKAGMVCGRYEKHIFFDLEEQQESATGRFRRPLLTLAERQCMSELLTSSVPPRLAHRHITSLDETHDDTFATDDFNVFRGPFGVFRVTQHHGTVQVGHTGDTSSFRDEPTTRELPRHELQSTSEDMYSTDLAFSPGTMDMIDSMLVSYDFNAQPYDIDELFKFSHADRNVDRSDKVLITRISQPWVTDPHPFDDRAGDHPPQALMKGTLPLGSGSSSVAKGKIVPQDAVVLLKHYSTKVLPLLAPFRHSKTPWHVLFVPHAKNCLAALSLGEDVDWATLCNFYGMLAISAYSLSGVMQMQSWLEKGTLYEQQAREYAESMLETAYDVPKTAKYKSILVALLTTVQVSVISRSPDQTDLYFLEAEKFIRLRGLNRRKSRKVRLLHHCYAFERIFHESTFVTSLRSDHRRHVRQAIESSGLGGYSRDSLSFQGIHSSVDLEKEMLRLKCQDEGENDLHIEMPGLWSATLHPEIFGIPEPWLMLLSLIIRLAKEKEGSKEQCTRESEGKPMSLQAFLNHAKSIERCIQLLQRPSDNSDLDILLEAMQSAIAIYFYRRIYDLDALLLQTRVSCVRDCLARLDAASQPDPAFGAARLIWPAFIAAREAQDVDVQASFANWFRASAQQSGLRLFTDTLASVERTWQRSGPAGDPMTWLGSSENQPPVDLTMRIDGSSFA
ncbi:uncharacterized protein LTR77_000554 [Saxophila tyrrhenica]|uniref:Zn(2)-C6 fungal-type domain-containing protein n=1 Tax=Saxophila tyrrhenica TaxID=1690608 RepID=A0AAV9PSW7_9PEZI|nr:hypothetical protein LTR77_000554 [Saxophila tyrrhenica]